MPCKCLSRWLIATWLSVLAGGPLSGFQPPLERWQVVDFVIDREQIDRFASACSLADDDRERLDRLHADYLRAVTAIDSEAAREIRALAPPALTNRPAMSEIRGRSREHFLEQAKAYESIKTQTDSIKVESRHEADQALTTFLAEAQAELGFDDESISALRRQALRDDYFQSAQRADFMHRIDLALLVSEATQTGRELEAIAAAKPGQPEWPAAQALETHLEEYESALQEHATRLLQQARQPIAEAFIWLGETPASQWDDVSRKQARRWAHEFDLIDSSQHRIRELIVNHAGIEAAQRWTTRFHRALCPGMFQGFLPDTIAANAEQRCDIVESVRIRMAETLGQYHHQLHPTRLACIQAGIASHRLHLQGIGETAQSRSYAQALLAMQKHGVTASLELLHALDGPCRRLVIRDIAAAAGEQNLGPFIPGPLLEHTGFTVPHETILGHFKTTLERLERE